MILGFAFTTIGYAIFYWGIHHFPGVDCPKSSGGASGCRYSLLDCLGFPTSWGIQKGSPLQVAPGGPPSQNISGGAAGQPGSSAGGGSNVIQGAWCALCCNTFNGLIFGINCPGCNC